MPVIEKLKVRLERIRVEREDRNGEVQRDALAALNRVKGGAIYEGTAAGKKVAKRRAKNRIAKQPRKVNR